MIHNMDAYITNGLLEIVPVIEITKEELDTVINLINSIQPDNPLLENVSPDSPLSLSSSELFRKMVGEIRSGSVVTIYTPSDNSEPFFSDQETSNYEKSARSLTDELTQIVESQERNFERNENIERLMKLRNEEEVKNVNRSVVIITKPASHPLPLPSWHEVGPEPSRHEP